MTARSIRRAQERKAKKLARKASTGREAASPNESGTSADLDVARESVVRATPSREVAVAATAPVDPETEVAAPEEPTEISPARLAANRANAALSTGPRTPEGKAHSSTNALKTALTGRSVLLPSDAAAAYEQYVERFVREFQPVGVRECELVQSIADTNWRLRRIPTLEFALYARGRTEFAEKFAAEPAASQPAMIELETYLVYEKQFRNLQLQETRLRRQRDKDLADLRAAQQERHQQEAKELAAAAGLYQVAKNRHRPFDPAEHGFEFSIEDIESYLEGARAAQAIRELTKAAA